jgi:hypothetical protein
MKIGSHFLTVLLPVGLALTPQLGQAQSILKRTVSIQKQIKLSVGSDGKRDLGQGSLQIINKATNAPVGGTLKRPKDSLDLGAGNYSFEFTPDPGSNQFYLFLGVQEQNTHTRYKVQGNAETAFYADKYDLASGQWISADATASTNGAFWLVLP